MVYMYICVYIYIVYNIIDHLRKIKKHQPDVTIFKPKDYIL